MNRVSPRRSERIRKGVRSGQKNLSQLDPKETQVIARLLGDMVGPLPPGNVRIGPVPRYPSAGGAAGRGRIGTAAKSGATILVARVKSMPVDQVAEGAGVRMLRAPVERDSAKVRINYTKILNSGVETDVMFGGDIGLEMGVYIDPSLWRHGYRYRFSFRTLNLATGSVQRNYRDGFVDALPGYSFWVMRVFSTPQGAVPGDGGLCIYRPSVVVDKGAYFDGLVHWPEHSVFALAEEHPFYIEEPTG